MKHKTSQGYYRSLALPLAFLVGLAFWLIFFPSDKEIPNFVAQPAEHPAHSPETPLETIPSPPTEIPEKITQPLSTGFVPITETPTTSASIAPDSVPPSSPALKETLDEDNQSPAHTASTTETPSSETAHSRKTSAFNSTAEVPHEYLIKAIFLLRSSYHIDFPEYVFFDEDAAFNICVLGENPFGQALEDAVLRSEQIHQRPIEIQYLTAVQDTLTCHIVYISASEAFNLAEILLALEDFPILTTSDIEGFSKQGGIMEFYRRGKNGIRLMLNLRKLEEAKLKADSTLLRIATLVSSPNFNN